jgi:uncharacterized protein (DUF2147 family)
LIFTLLSLKKYIFCLIFAAITSLSSFGQTPVGVWLTFDDETNEQKSQIRIEEQGGRLFGKIIGISRASLNHRCDKCSDHRKDQYILGMVIIEDMALIDGHWQGGRVLYPRQGRWYSLKFWLAEGDPNTLVVRGSVGPFYKTQYWKRA